MFPDISFGYMAATEIEQTLDLDRLKIRLDQKFILSSTAYIQRMDRFRERTIDFVMDHKVKFVVGIGACATVGYGYWISTWPLN